MGRVNNNNKFFKKSFILDRCCLFLHKSFYNVTTLFLTLWWWLFLMSTSAWFEFDTNPHENHTDERYKHPCRIGKVPPGGVSEEHGFVMERSDSDLW